jgi:hypothetical protein
MCSRALDQRASFIEMLASHAWAKSAPFVERIGLIKRLTNARAHNKRFG